MRQIVTDRFPGFTEKWEGLTTYPYLDVKGLVTVGVGNLIDPLPAALGLPWQNPDGSIADRGTIQSEWNTLKGRQDLKGHTAGSQANVTTIRLTMFAINDLVEQRMATDWAYLLKVFPDLEDWPADAQMGILSMAWAMGPAFVTGFPHFKAFCQAKQFAIYSLARDNVTRVLVGGAAAECRIDTTGNPGIAPRNSANLVLFENAQDVLDRNADPNTLFWPNGVPATTSQSSASPVQS